MRIADKETLALSDWSGGLWKGLLRVDILPPSIYKGVLQACIAIQGEEKDVTAPNRLNGR